MHPIIPFKIHVSDNELLNLHQKLELASLPEEFEGADWDYGVPLYGLFPIIAVPS